MILTLTLTLVLCVGLGEAYRTCPILQMEKLDAQAGVIRQAIEGLLRAGLPLEQYSGFSTLAAPLLASDATLLQILVLDRTGRLLFREGEIPAAIDVPPEVFVPSAGDGPATFEGEQVYAVRLPLANRYERLGSLVVVMSKARMVRGIRSAFRNLGFLALVLATLSLSVVAGLRRGRPEQGALTLHATYAAAFLLLAAAVCTTLIFLYSAGIHEKAEALTRSLSRRLQVPLELGISLDRLEGIDRMFRSYQRLNPEISSIALLEEGVVRVHSDPALVNTPWRAGRDQFEYTSTFEQALGAGLRLELRMAIPRRVVYEKVGRSARNLVILFLATALLSRLFLRWAVSSRAQPENALENGRDGGGADPGMSGGIEGVRTHHTLTVLMEGLCVSFLPSYFERTMGAAAVSTIFLAFFTAHAATLLPAGRFAETRQGSRKLMRVGVALAALGLAGLTQVESFYGVLGLRALSGVGQAMNFIGVQSHLLAAGRRRTTRAASVLVHGYNTGMISGTALGALLVLYTGPRLVFATATVVGLLNLLRGRRLGHGVPATAPAGAARGGEAATGPEISPGPADRRGPRLPVRVLRCLGEPGFLRAALLIGIPTRAVLTGVVFYALPLLLDRAGYARDSIGQVLIFYSGGILCANHLAPRLAGRPSRLSGLLVAGSLGSGLGLVLMSRLGSGDHALPFAVSGVASVVAGTALLGLAHGLIHAPIVSYVAGTTAARRLGKDFVTSTYRLLERIGFAAGPVLVAGLLAAGGGGPAALARVGALVAASGLLFRILGRRPEPRKTGPGGEA